jgi:hypothetical protein
LILFTTASARNSSVPIGDFSAWLNVDRAELPARTLMAHLFGADSPALPGICFFKTFGGVADIIYFDLSSFSELAGLRTALRRILWLANQAEATTAGKNGRFVNALAVSAQKERLPYVLTRPVSLRVWLVRTYQFFQRNSGDILAAVGMGL